MSAPEATEQKKSEQFVHWKEQPYEVKVMDLASIAWFIMVILTAIFAFFIEFNLRTFPTLMFPLFMFLFTISLRYKLVDKPSALKNIFITWVVVFCIMLLVSILIITKYPPLIST